MSYIFHRLHENKTAAHVAPLVVFLTLLALVPVFKVDHPALPWWQQGPEHWIYPLQTIVSLILVGAWWRHYQFGPLAIRHAIFGAAIGVIGIVLWLFPSWLHSQTGWEMRWLGVTSRAEPGFDPGIFAENPAAWWTTVLLRFARMTVAVPLIEEIFWRGFLWRYLANPDRPWTETPFGSSNPRALIGTSVLMMFAHQPVDWAACFVWALLVGWVAIRTRSLAACVICHATSNLLLGLYAVAYKQWGLW